MVKLKTTIKLPSISIPSLSTPTKNPPGWGTSEVAIKSRGGKGANRFSFQEPAGDPPANWPGTRPEWAVYWALTGRGLKEGSDFQYTANVPGVESGYYSTLDFFLPGYRLGIEVQGQFWHYGQGSAKIFNDQFRALAFAQQNIKVIFIDENDALKDPAYFVGEALLGVDHSIQSRKF